MTRIQLRYYSRIQSHLIFIWSSSANKNRLCIVIAINEFSLHWECPQDISELKKNKQPFTSYKTQIEKQENFNTNHKKKKQKTNIYIDILLVPAIFPIRLHPLHHTTGSTRIHSIQPSIHFI